MPGSIVFHLVTIIFARATGSFVVSSLIFFILSKTMFAVRDTGVVGFGSSFIVLFVRVSEVGGGFVGLLVVIDDVTFVALLYDELDITNSSSEESDKISWPLLLSLLRFSAILFII